MIDNNSYGHTNYRKVVLIAQKYLWAEKWAFSLYIMNFECPQLSNPLSENYEILHIASLTIKDYLLRISDFLTIPLKRYLGFTFEM